MPIPTLRRSGRVLIGFIGLLALGWLLSTTLLYAQHATSASDARLIESLRSFIPHLMRQTGAPGLSIALARRGEVIWEEGFGFADLERKIPMTPQIVTHSGSMGKTYTATAIMQLVERGIIGLYDPINKYLKDFQVRNPFGEREITVYDLLTHRSGLTRNTAGSQLSTPKALGIHLREGYAQKAFKSYRGVVSYTGTSDSRWRAKVGEQYLYSNFGIATLGYLVEVANPEGLSFSEYVQRHIMDPLGMTSSRYPAVQDAAHLPPDIFGRMSKGYATFGPISIPTPTIYFADYPAGTAVFTPGDHIRLLLAYLNEGTYQGYQLLKPETVKHMLSPQEEQGSGNGLVWMLGSTGQINEAFGHGGAHMFGWRGGFYAYPKQDFAVVVLTNHWTMIYSNPSRRTEYLAIPEFISSWLEREQRHVRHVPPSRSWAWKTSYLIGMIMAEQLKGFLGIEETVTSEAIAAMARGAKVRAEAGGGEPLWDAEGFRAGMQDMLAVEMTPDGIRAFLGSERLQVGPEELVFLHRELGGAGQPFPILQAVAGGR